MVLQTVSGPITHIAQVCSKYLVVRLEIACFKMELASHTSTRYAIGI